MELNDSNLQSLANYLQQTLSPEVSVRKPAEKFLESIEVTQNFPLLLLHLVGKEDLPLNIRLSGAVAFKNFVKRNWRVDTEEGQDRIHSSDREAVKNLIVDLMLRSPESIQRQLSDAVSLIGRHDFPDNWPGLISQMVEKFSSGDFHVINGVLRTAHSLFKHYTFELKSLKLWTEIKYVLDTFAKPFTDLFVATMNLTTVHANNVEVLKVLYSSLTIICKVFYSLNYQDLPEFFEDNMETWMSNFHTLLNKDVKELRTEEDEEVGPLEMLKSQICDIVSLYAQKYDEDFQHFLPQMVTDVWNLLVTTGPQPKYDVLVSNALQFLVSVADRPYYSKLFEDPTVLSSICEKVIIPNVEFGTSDEELFGDNPEEYLQRDLQGSDVGTRRRSACDLVRALSNHFEAQMMSVFGNYVQAMLTRYAENPESNWRCKDAALYLVTSLTVKGSTQKQGTTQISQLVNIGDFAGQHIYPELAKTDVTSLPVIRADAIKYIITFRNQLPAEVLVGQVLPRLIHLLTSPHRVVHTYAACALGGILSLRIPSPSGDGVTIPAVNADNMLQLSRDLLTNLFGVFSFPGSEENEFAMKGIMLVFCVMQEKSLPLMEEALPKLTNKLTAAAKNPSRPHFNHYLFETLALSISIACKATPTAAASFEAVLFPIFQEILQQDVQEFIPYIFQLLSLLLELRPDEGGEGKAVSAPYMALLPFLITPVLWDSSGNVVPLARLLCAYVSRGGSEVNNSSRLNGLLGVFQKLIASKLNDGEGFRLISALLLHCPEAELSPFVRQVFVVLFQRLSFSKTLKFVKGLLAFFSLYIVKCGASTFVELLDSIQQRMFAMVVERLIVIDVQKISGKVNRKLVAVGITKLLTECTQVTEGQYSNMWAPLLTALIELFELPEDDSDKVEEVPYMGTEVDPNAGGYQAAYSKLTFAQGKETDHLAHIVDAKLNLAVSLGKLSAAHPGRLGPLIQAGLSPEGRAHLERYFAAANVSLA